MPTLLAALLFALALRAQPPAPEAARVAAPEAAPEAKDTLGRNTPQESVFQFLEACHARDYAKATYYLDLRRMPAGRLPSMASGTGSCMAVSPTLSRC